MGELIHSVSSPPHSNTDRPRSLQDPSEDVCLTDSQGHVFLCEMSRLEIDIQL